MSDYFEALEAHNEAHTDPKNKTPEPMTPERQAKMLAAMRARANA